jgi:hypothetical protein
MSAIGTKRTSACALHMTAFDPKRTWRLRTKGPSPRDKVREEARRSRSRGIDILAAADDHILAPALPFYQQIGNCCQLVLNQTLLCGEGAKKLSFESRPPRRKAICGLDGPNALKIASLPSD